MYRERQQQLMSRTLWVQIHGYTQIFYWAFIHRLHTIRHTYIYTYIHEGFLKVKSFLMTDNNTNPDQINRSSERLQPCKSHTASNATKSPHLLLSPPRSRMILQSFTAPNAEKKCFNSFSVVYNTGLYQNLESASKTLHTSI